jgi:hypothetical protein
VVRVAKCAVGHTCLPTCPSAQATSSAATPKMSPQRCCIASACCCTATRALATSAGQLAWLAWPRDVLACLGILASSAARSAWLSLHAQGGWGGSDCSWQHVGQSVNSPGRLAQVVVKCRHDYGHSPAGACADDQSLRAAHAYCAEAHHLLTRAQQSSPQGCDVLACCGMRLLRQPAPCYALVRTQDQSSALLSHRPGLAYPPGCMASRRTAGPWSARVPAAGPAAWGRAAGRCLACCACRRGKQAGGAWLEEGDGRAGGKQVAAGPQSNMAACQQGSRRAHQRSGLAYLAHSQAHQRSGLAYLAHSQAHQRSGLAYLAHSGSSTWRASSEVRYSASGTTSSGPASCSSARLMSCSGGRAAGIRDQG